MTSSSHIVIVGGGQAASQTCQSLRQFGHEGSITLIGDEVVPPYQRPPLSKAFMKGEMEEQRLYFRPSEWYAEQNIALRLGETVTRIDVAAKTVTVGGEEVGYDALVLATGSRPRPLPLAGAGLGRVFDLRSLADVEAIRPQMKAGKRLAIIGAGYIGLEAAAVARQLGLGVTVFERADRVLARVTSPIMSEFFTGAHEREGVDFRLGADVARLDGGADGVSAVIEADGAATPCDMVLAGIGILPNVELADAAGLACEDGIVVDADGRTSVPDIFAAGDCTRRPLIPYGKDGRLESVHNAIEQGKAVAAAICEKPAPKADCPWFWSDQYDLKLQIAGLSAGFDDMVVRGDVASRTFAVFYLRAGKLIAADAVNRPPEFMMAKKMILAGASPDPAHLADTDRNMKDIAMAALSRS